MPSVHPHTRGENDAARRGGADHPDVFFLEQVEETPT
jgi:hypothetical protein